MRRLIIPDFEGGERSKIQIMSLDYLSEEQEQENKLMSVEGLLGR